MSKKDEALKLAIEFIEGGGGWGSYQKEILNFCKEALAESEASSRQETQEPVGEVSWFEGTVLGAIYPTSNMPKDGEKLYTHPLKQLTDDEIEDKISGVEYLGKIKMEVDE